MYLYRIYLSDNAILVIQGNRYRRFRPNTSKQHINAPKALGGVGMFVKNTVFEYFNVRLCDNT